ncbi:BP74-related protein [Variovorax sp. LARHSF232]
MLADTLREANRASPRSSRRRSGICHQRNPKASLAKASKCDDRWQSDPRVSHRSRTTTEHVQGTVVARAADYNPGWSFHLDPKTSSLSNKAFTVRQPPARSLYRTVDRGCSCPARSTGRPTEVTAEREVPVIRIHRVEGPLTLQAGIRRTASIGGSNWAHCRRSADTIHALKRTLLPWMAGSAAASVTLWTL